jgi:hypothetical protein
MITATMPLGAYPTQGAGLLDVGSATVTVGEASPERGVTGGLSFGMAMIFDGGRSSGIFFGWGGAIDAAKTESGVSALFGGKVDLSFRLGPATAGASYGASWLTMPSSGPPAGGSYTWLAGTMHGKLTLGPQGRIFLQASYDIPGTAVLAGFSADFAQVGPGWANYYADFDRYDEARLMIGYDFGGWALRFRAVEHKIRLLEAPSNALDVTWLRMSIGIGWTG